MPNNEMEMFFRSVLPPGPLWRLFKDGDFQKLLDGMGENAQVIYEYLSQLAHIRDPYKTPILSDLEREYGILSDNNLTDETRRKQLAAIQYSPKGSGSISLLQDKLTQAGFDLLVVANNPVIDPRPFVLEGYLTYAGEALAQAGEPLALAGKFGGELIVANTETIDPETKGVYEYEISDRSDLWRFIFFVTGGATCYTPLQDWNMERADVASWPPGPYTTVSKNTVEKESGLRGLEVAANRNPDEQNIYPIQPDPSLEMSLYKSHNEAYKNYLIDGDMEDIGTAAYTPGSSAVLTKEITDVQSGLRCLRVSYGGVNNPYATQNALTIGRVYSIDGWARGDGTRNPRLRDGGVSIWTGSNSTDWQKIEIEITAANISIMFQSLGGTGYCEFDSISINEIPDLQDSDMETIGVADWSIGNSATLTKDTTDPYTGSQSLKVARNGVNDPYAYQSIMVSTEQYKVTGRARSFGVGVKATVAFGTSIKWNGSIYDSWQAFEIYGVGDATTELRFGSNATTGTDYVKFDDIEISPILGPTANNNGAWKINTPFGQGHWYDGISDHVLGDASYGAGLTDDFTICAWIKNTDLWANLVSRDDNINRSWAMRIANGLLNFQDTVGTNWSSAVNVDDDLWHYVVVVINGSNSRMYVDAVPDTAYPSFTPSITAYTLLPEIGSYGIGTLGFYAGDMVAPEIYGEAKTLAWIESEYARGLETSLKGSYVEQEFIFPVESGKQINGWAKSGPLVGEIDIPMVAVRNSITGVWSYAWLGVESASGQSISFTTTFEIDAIRLYCKFAEVGRCYFDNIDITDPSFTYGQVPNESKEVLRRIISKYKPMHSWCALLVEYV